MTTTRSLADACIAQRRIDTPLGALLLARTEHGLAGAWFDDQRHHPAPFAHAPDDPLDALLDRAAHSFAAYFDGSAGGFDEIALDFVGTEFQRAVWQQLLNIARGTTTTYGAIARRLGEPSASRAVGAAVGRNPLGIVVPCHRVVGSDGSLTGYAAGLDRKLALLRLEQASIARQAPVQRELLEAN